LDWQCGGHCGLRVSGCKDRSMKCYFDGSRAAGPSEESWLTLAGFMVSDEFWKSFQQEWVTEVLQKREPHAPYLHMTDLLSGKGPFQGWDQTRRHQLAMDAVYYLQQLPKDGFSAIVCSLDEKARKRLIAEGYAIAEPHCLCGHLAIYQAFMWYYETHPERLEGAEICFDQNERFKHPFRQRWEKENKGKRLVTTDTFWGLIKGVDDLDMRKTPPLQAADVLAWGASRRFSGVERPFLYLAEVLEKVVPIGECG